MKQILQHLGNGLLEIAELPTPQVSRNNVLIQTQASLISAGTERMLVEFGKSNMLQKARSQPEKVKQVLEKLSTDGILPTMEAVMRKLDQPLPLGYSNAGIVRAVGADVHDLKAGDRVASNGHHAEMVSVPRNLCAPIPDGVSYEEAAFTTLASIALQGVRLAEPTFGEMFMVFGTGLLGLLSIQLLRANGCDVLAVDFNEGRLKLAQQYGAQTVHLAQGEDPIARAKAWTQQRGVDGVLVTASAPTDEIMHQAAQASRKRGRIILVGVVGLQLQRSDFFEKELRFQVSCSYGPGRYDPSYEQQGRDYPLGFVRWTEQRNFEAILQAMKQQRIQVDSLITHRFPLDQATKAYDLIQGDPEALGIVLQYPQTPLPAQPQIHIYSSAQPTSQAPRVGVIGAGNFAVATMLPALAKSSAQLDMVVDNKPFAAQHAAKKFRARRASTQYQDLLQDQSIDAVFLLTGHHLHANQVCEALEAKKHVFVEKPLAIDEDGLSQIIECVSQHPDRLLMVGFNRRFSPHIQHIQQHLHTRTGPLCMQMTVNAGDIPPDHWVQDPHRGGGRIIGEACHFLDLLSFLANSPISVISAMRVGEGPAVRDDKMTITAQMADGSVGTVHYFANGSKSFPKETLELFFDQRVIRMENYRTTSGYGFSSFKTLRTLRQDKGHQAEIDAFLQALRRGGPAPIPFHQMVNITRASFAAVTSAHEGTFVRISSNLEPTHTNGTAPAFETSPSNGPSSTPTQHSAQPQTDL